MAEFDSSAFSALDSFFGIDTEPSKSTKSSASSTVGKKNKRLGVGAATKPEPPKKTDTTSRLLQVGKKKRKNDEDDEGLVVAEDDEDDEDEVGRTGIATERPKAVEQEAEKPKKKKKKKKKAGKKERQKQKEAEQANTEEKTNQDEENNDPETEASKDDSKEEDGNTQKDDPDGTQKEKADNPHKPKRKRRKVRSRQKNIYKDNRTADQRPDHLVPGGFEYKGRPMTTATRSKLKGKNLLSPREENKDTFRANWDTTDQELQDNGIPVLGTEKVLDRSDDAIHTRKGKPKKKSKYKNIQ